VEAVIVLLLLLALTKLSRGRIAVVDKDDSLALAVFQGRNLNSITIQTRRETTRQPFLLVVFWSENIHDDFLL